MRITDRRERILKALEEKVAGRDNLRGARNIAALPVFTEQHEMYRKADYVVYDTDRKQVHMYEAADSEQGLFSAAKRPLEGHYNWLVLPRSAILPGHAIHIPEGLPNDIGIMLYSETERKFRVVRKASYRAAPEHTELWRRQVLRKGVRIKKGNRINEKKTIPRTHRRHARTSRNASGNGMDAAGQAHRCTRNNTGHARL